MLIATLLREYGMPVLNFLFSKPWFSMPTKMPGLCERGLFEVGRGSVGSARVSGRGSVRSARVSGRGSAGFARVSGVSATTNPTAPTTPPQRRNRHKLSHLPAF